MITLFPVHKVKFATETALLLDKTKHKKLTIKRYVKKAAQVSWESLPVVDRHMLHRFALLMGDLRDSYEGYQFSRFFQARCLQSLIHCGWHLA